MADTDVWMRERSGLSVAEVVEAEGWDGFRRREAEALRAVAAPKTVIATGGGMVLLPENRTFMRETGRVVYLEAPLRLLRKRLLASPQAAQRPSLTGKGLVEEIEDILKARAPMYRECAHLRANAGLPLYILINKLTCFLESA